MWLLIVLTVVLVAVIHWLLNSSYDYWKKKGVPFPTPRILVGNFGQSITLSKSVGQIYDDVYYEYTDCLYVGMYKVRTPVLLIRDMELIKDVLVKNFSSFQDNDMEVDEKLDPILAKNPFFLRGHKWKVVRTQVSSNITTGKIKNMFPIIANVGKDMVTYLNTEIETAGKEGLESKELAAKYTTDVVAACAFGLEGKSFVDPNSEFREMGKKMLSYSTWMAMKHMIIFLFPSLANLFQMRFLPVEAQDWIKGVLLQTIREREKNNIVKNDYLDMMINLKTKSSEYEFTDMDVIAQAMTFYLDGYETSSIAISFTLYELAANPDIQTKLRKEIVAVLAKHDGEITYDAIQEMPYLDNVFSESLRMYPPGTFIGKLCTKPYTFPPPKGEGTGPEVQIEVGTPVMFPIYAIHHDPQYYPDPEKFDPDRFTDEIKNSRHKYAYFPFGEGPRQCLGLKFALVQNKTAIISIIKNFELKVNPKTTTPIEIDPSYFLLAPKGGLWLDFRKIAN